MKRKKKKPKWFWLHHHRGDIYFEEIYHTEEAALTALLEMTSEKKTLFEVGWRVVGPFKCKQRI